MGFATFAKAVAGRASRWLTAGGARPLAIGLIVAAGWAAYANSFCGVFVLDDLYEIERNPAIRQLWPPAVPMFQGSGLPRRPIPYYTFALNYALGGYEVWGYHLLNLAVHLACALLLFAVVRRTLAGGRLAAPYGQAATGIALATALLWTVHPLQTQAVTYVYQRLESLAAMFYLLTLYCFLRGVSADRPGPPAEPRSRRLPVATHPRPERSTVDRGETRGSRLWLWGSVVACALGMASKETMVTAPLLVLWYDRVFVAASWKELARRRWTYHASLAATWLLLAAVISAQTERYGELVTPPHTPLAYALNQGPVILHYFKLAFWPQDQCLYYLWQEAGSVGALLPSLATIAALAGACLVCMLRYPRLGFLLGSFWLLLAPTSSIFPVYELAFEHRMYLPLAALAGVVVLAGYEATRRVIAPPKGDSPIFATMLRTVPAKIGTVPTRRRIAVAAAQIAAVAALTIVLAAATTARNAVYHSYLGMWMDVIAKAPHNWEAYDKLARCHFEMHNYAEAAKYGRLTLQWSPPPRCRHDATALAAIHGNLGIALLRSGDRPGAVEHLRRSVELDANIAPTWVNLGNLLIQTSPDAAMACYRQALKLDPACAEAYNNLGWVLAGRDPEQALPYFERALAIEPALADARNNLERCLRLRHARSGR
jgi:tetratricopeptide (TPR) repeat protein